MASGQKRGLVPDEKILSTIFRGVADVKLTGCNIISNTFDTCTFSIHLEIVPPSSYPQDLVVRLETSGSRLAAVAALQRLAEAQLPDLVPSVLDVGTATATDGRLIEYSVTAYCTGTIMLEDVWETLGQTNQLELMDSVVHAMEKLQKLDRNSEDTSLEPMKTSIGSPQLGYFPGVKQLLGGIIRASNSKSPNCTLLEIDGGVVLESAFEDIGRVELTHSDLDDLQHHVVFCHNDLEPRNILVKETPSTEGKSLRYELAAVIDWEMAGFYPFAYEYGFKDTVLGSSNMFFSWYYMFKERTSHLLPRPECHTKLIKALKIIDESKKKSITRNVGIRVQAKWVGREKVEKSPDPRQGWVRKAGAKGPGAFTKDDQSNLELEVLKELGLV